MLDTRSTPDSPGRGGPEYKFDVNAFLGYPPDRFEGVQCVVALRPAGPYDYGLVHRIFGRKPLPRASSRLTQWAAMEHESLQYKIVVDGWGGQINVIGAAAGTATAVEF